MKNYIITILITLLAIPSFGQSISIFDIDTTNFPLMKAKFYAFDKDGKQVTPNISDLKLTENGINRTITNVSCPPPVPQQTVSVAMSIDISGSMGSSNFVEIPVELGKLTATDLCNLIYMPPSSFALQTCNDKAYILQDFTKNRNNILNKIPEIKAGGGNEFFEHLLNNQNGLLNIAKLGKNKRVAVLYTDAWWYALTPSQLKSCIDICKNFNIEFYTIIYSRSEAEPNGIKASLKELCAKTGGFFYDGVTSKEAAKDIADKIQQMIQGRKPCEITWTSDVSCLPNNTNLELTWQSQKSFLDYVPSNNSIAKLNVYPNFIAFGKRLPKAQYDTLITFTALKADITINRINLKYGSNSFSIINSSFPITIPKNSSKEITLRFSPNDSSLSYASFDIETDKCLAYFSANGGFPGKKSSSTTLKLTHPNGGETFVAGSDTIISWKGVSPTDTVTLEYSSDNSVNWKQITNQATNLQFVWKKVPLPTSMQCIVRASQVAVIYDELNFFVDASSLARITFSSDGGRVATAIANGTAKIWDANTGVTLKTLKGHTDVVYDISFSPDGSRLATASWDGTAKIWDVNTGAEIITLKGHTQQVNDISFSPDGSRIATASWDGTTKIWDANTGTEIITLLGGFYTAYSPDGSQIATASNDGDGTVKISDANTGTEIRLLTGHTNGFHSIAYSPNGSRIASAGNDGTVKIWDANTGAEFRTLIGHTQRVNDIAFSPDGSRIASASNDGTAKIWEVNTGLIIRNLIWPTYVVGIAFSPDGNRVATSGWNGSAKIWDLDLDTIQQDASDSVFSIVAQSPLSQNVDMKQCLVGASKDSLISTFMINNGNYQYRVDSIAITGANASEFRLVSGTPPFIVPANDNRAVEFNFKPTSVGIKTAQLIIYTQADTLYQTIQGEGVAPQLEIVNNLIDFGLVDVGQFKDTIQVVTIKNVGSAALNITNSLHLGPNDVDFTTLSGAAPFNLNAGETARMNLRFAPKAKGRTSGRLQFEYNGVGSPATVQLFGTGIGNNAIIKAGSDTAYIGEQVEIPVSMEIPNSLIKDGVTAISFELEMNKTILFPIGINCTIEGENRIIKFDIVPIKNVGINEVTKLKFIATLGNAEGTPIHIRNFVPIGNDADFDVFDGNFKLLGVCKDGGERFLSGTIAQTKLFAISPNPAAESIEIEYANADDGLAEISISDILGQTVLVQKLEKTQTGKVKLDLSQIQTGQYYLLFKTESIIENKVIQIIK